MTIADLRLGAHALSSIGVVRSVVPPSPADDVVAAEHGGRGERPGPDVGQVGRR